MTPVSLRWPHRSFGLPQQRGTHGFQLRGVHVPGYDRRDARQVFIRIGARHPASRSTRWRRLPGGAGPAGLAVAGLAGLAIARGVRPAGLAVAGLAGLAIARGVRPAGLAVAGLAGLAIARGVRPAGLAVAGLAGLAIARGVRPAGLAVAGLARLAIARQVRLAGPPVCIGARAPRRLRLPLGTGWRELSLVIRRGKPRLRRTGYLAAHQVNLARWPALDALPPAGGRRLQGGRDCARPIPLRPSPGTSPRASSRRTVAG